MKFIDSGVTDSGATVLTPLKKPDVTIQTTKGCTWTDVLSHQIDSDVATSESCESSCDEEVLAVDASCDVYEREPSLIPVLLEDFQDSGGEKFCYFYYFVKSVALLSNMLNIEILLLIYQLDFSETVIDANFFIVFSQSHFFNCQFVRSKNGKNYTL